MNPANMSPVGGLSHQGKIDPEVPAEKTKASRDPKRRTVQVEYVAPQSQTARGEVSPPAASPAAVGVSTTGAGSSKTRTRGTTEALNASPWQPGTAVSSKPLTHDPSTVANSGQERAYYSQQDPAKFQQKPSNSQQLMAPPTKPPKDLPRSVSDSTSAFAPLPSSTTGRPATSSSMTSGAGRLPSRGNSYSQPLAPTVAATNAQARLSQPNKNGKQYNISSPIPQSEPYYSEPSIGRPSTQQYDPAPVPAQQRNQPRGHKRSNTLGNLLGRSGSVFGGRSQSQSQRSPEPKPQQEKRYPPISMKNPIASDSPRQSTDSRRPSFSFGRKTSDYRKNSDLSKQEKPRRFSLLPASFSLKNLTGGSKEPGSTGPVPVSERRPSTLQQMPQSRGQSRPQTMAYSQGQSRSNSYRKDEFPSTGYDGQTERQHKNGTQQTRRNNGSSRAGLQPQQRYNDELPYLKQQEPLSPPRPPQGQSYLLGGSGTPTDSEISLGAGQHRPVYPPGFDSYENDPRPSMQKARGARGPAVLTKNNRKFADAYEQDQEPGQGSGGNHAGSSGAARRVMDFFRRRGKARAGDDRV